MRDTSPEVAVTVMLWVCCWGATALTVAAPASPATDQRRHTPCARHHITITMSRCSHLLERLILPANGSSKVQSATNGSLPPDCPFFSSIAVWGTWTFSVTVVAPLPATSDAGLNVAANPVGNPETERATAAGNVAPLMGSSVECKLLYHPAGLSVMNYLSSE
jgi:hypothetical protein